VLDVWTRLPTYFSHIQIRKFHVMMSAEPMALFEDKGGIIYETVLGSYAAVSLNIYIINGQLWRSHTVGFIILSELQDKGLERMERIIVQVVNGVSILPVFNYFPFPDNINNLNNFFKPFNCIGRDVVAIFQTKHLYLCVSFISLGKAIQ
jgi:hypothetical protein